MNSTAAHYRTVAAALTALVERVPRSAWEQASPCEGWSARDVLGHVVTTQRDFCACHDLAVGPAPDLTGDPAGGWRTHVQQLEAALADDEVPARSYAGYFGPTTLGAELEQFYVWDMVVHRSDIATATGADAGLSTAELDAIESGADSFGPALHSDGICGPPVEVSADADRQTRVLARLGRHNGSGADQLRRDQVSAP